MTALPRSRRAPRRADGVGLEAHQDLAGQATCRPGRSGATAAPAARAAATLAAERAHAGSSTCSALGQRAEGDRQLADGVAVGVDHERPVGVDRAPRRRAGRGRSGLVDVRALEDARAAPAQEPQPCDVRLAAGRRRAPRRRARRRARRTCRRRRPWSSRRRRSSRRSVRASPSTSTVKVAGFHAASAPQRAVDVDERPEARRRLVGDPVGVASRSRALAIPMNGAAVGQAQVDGRAAVRRRCTSHASTGSSGMPSHAREVVAAPAGQHARASRPGGRAARPRRRRGARRRAAPRPARPRRAASTASPGRGRGRASASVRRRRRGRAGAPRPPAARAARPPPAGGLTMRRRGRSTRLAIFAARRPGPTRGRARPAWRRRAPAPARPPPRPPRWSRR